MATERPDFELSAPSPGLSVGEQLGNARKQMGLSVESVAKQLKLAPRQVLALEADDTAQLPSGPFLRGFVRNYARFVGLNPEELLGQEHNRRVAVAPLAATPPSRGEIRESSISGSSSILKWLIPVVLTAILLVGATWYEVRRPKPTPTSEATTTVRPSPSTVAAVTTSPPIASAPAVPAEPPASQTSTAPSSPLPILAPAPTPETTTPAVGAMSTAATAPSAPAVPSAVTAIASAPPAPATPSGQVTLDLSFAEQSWTEIRDGAGNLLSSKTQAKGSRLTVAGQPPFRFTIGNARNVALSRNNTPVDLTQRIGAGDVAKFTLE